MIRKFKKYLRVVAVDVLIYHMEQSDFEPLAEIGFTLSEEPAPARRKRYFIMDEGICVHQSFLYKQLNILKLIGKKGPAIGDCVTIPEYKGKSIYPFVINRIAGEMLQKENVPEVFIIVGNGNASSIRGIEKAGFKFHTAIKAKRFLLFYYSIRK